MLYAVLFTITMPLIAKYSEELAEARSVMTGRMVDSYTNIQTLKTFSTGGYEDKYVANSVMEHAMAFRRLMRVFTYMWSILFLLNAGLVIAIAGLSLCRLGQRHAHRRGGGDSDPVRPADHEHVRLDPRCRLQHLPPDRHGEGFDGHHRPADHDARQAGCARLAGERRAASSSTTSASTTGAARRAASSRTSRSRSRLARRSGSSAGPARASRRWSISHCGFSTCTRARSGSTGRTSAA